MMWEDASRHGSLMYGMHSGRYTTRTAIGNALKIRSTALAGAAELTKNEAAGRVRDDNSSFSAGKPSLLVFVSHF
ncbi:hypothetical protein Y032_0288g1472 [Ancylostoma ceylanicum]|uniref:Uncharacterized protein n=1 Tax=Ancylostoma ceylanicum TaxID=53326 RepID=A0A016S6P4_9BILA|nr:hypothetical protein Y032_0288g1472 [Ancylostoma ceylanicum]